MSAEEETKSFYVPSIGRSLTVTQIDNLVAMFANAPWKLLVNILVERRETLVKMGMAVNTDDEIRAKARGEYAGISSLLKLPQDIEDSKRNDTQEPVF